MTGSTRDDLVRHMQEARVAYLSALFGRCRARFVEAARLVGADLAQWPMLGVISVKQGVDVANLLWLWDAVCQRYLDEKAEAQLALFEDNLSVVEAFSRWVHWELWPRLTLDNGFVRSVLQACRALPAVDQEDAGFYLRIHVEGMTFAAKMVANDLDDQDLL